MTWWRDMRRHDLIARHDMTWHDMVFNFMTWKSMALQVDIRKILYLNCKERYEDMIDKRKCAHNFSSLKKIQTWTGFEPMISVIPVQSSTNWAIKPSGSWSFCLVTKVRGYCSLKWNGNIVGRDRMVHGMAWENGIAWPGIAIKYVMIDNTYLK